MPDFGLGRGFGAISAYFGAAVRLSANMSGCYLLRFDAIRCNMVTSAANGSR